MHVWCLEKCLVQRCRNKIWVIPASVCLSGPQRPASIWSERASFSNHVKECKEERERERTAKLGGQRTAGWSQDIQQTLGKINWLYNYATSNLHLCVNWYSSNLHTVQSGYAVQMVGWRFNFDDSVLRWRREDKEASEGRLTAEK